MATPAAVRFDFDPATHRYTVDGQPIPSVSQVLRAAGLVDYDGIPPDVLAYAAERGTAVHLACQYYDEGDLDPATLDPHLAPYVAAWRKFREDHDFRILASERMYLGNLRGMQYGLTVDRLLEIGGVVCVLDIKTSRDIHPWHAIQLAGYAIGISGFAPKSALSIERGLRRIIVQLRPGGTYQLHSCQNQSDGEVFAAALRIAYWKLGLKSSEKS